MSLFPSWNPQHRTVEAIKHVMSYPLSFMDQSRKRRAFCAVRDSSSNFVKRKDVRLFIFYRDGFQCRYCEGTEDLTIDHIVSVYDSFFKGYIPLPMLNTEENLQCLCRKCNSSKPHLRKH